MLKFTFFISRKGVGKALLSKVFKEAESRDIHNVYTFVRVDNKVSICLLKMFTLQMSRLGLLWEESLDCCLVAPANTILLSSLWRRFFTTTSKINPTEPFDYYTRITHMYKYYTLCRNTLYCTYINILFIFT